MIFEIGECSGKVWEYLREKGPDRLSEIGRSLKLDKSLLNMAVGWLAREDKLAFEGKGRTLKISLK